MAKLEKHIHGDFDATLAMLDEGIMGGSMSASLEDSSDFSCGRRVCAAVGDGSAQWLCRVCCRWAID